MPNENPSTALTGKKEEEQQPKQAGLDVIVDDYRADMARSMKVWEEGTTLAREKETEQLGKAREQLRGIQKGMEGVKPPTTETLPELPKVPKIKARDFLQGGPKDDPWHTMQNMVMGLGLLATMGASGKHPQTALAALAGAMTGWAEGDHKRAQSEWATYMKNVERAKNEQDRIKSEIEQKWKVYGANKDMLSMQLGIWGAERGLDREYIDMLMKQPEQALAKANFDAKMMQDIWNQTFKMTMFQVNNAHKIASQAETKRHHLTTEDLARQRATFSAQITKMWQADEGLEVLQTKLNRVKDAVGLLNVHNLLPQGSATAIDKTAAQLRYQQLFFRNDIDNAKKQEIAAAMDTLKRFGTATLIGQEMALGATASVMRIKSIAEAEAGNASMIPKTFWDQFFADAMPSLEKRRTHIRMQLNRARDMAPLFGAPASSVEIVDPTSITPAEGD